MDIRIPQLAEGIQSATVVGVLVKVGDSIKKDQPLVELETEKAVAPLPSSAAGKVEKILVKEGDAVSVGQVVLTLSGAGPGSGKEAPPSQPEVVETQRSGATPKPVEPAAPLKMIPGIPPPASPHVRKMAHEFGIDLARVRGTERGGRITVEDIKAYIASLQMTSSPGLTGGSTTAGPRLKHAGMTTPLPDFSQWGPVTRNKMTSLRKKISERMVESWTSIPHVTQFDEADITSLLELRTKHAKAYEAKGVKLTLTGFLLKAVSQNLKKHPVFNASLDEAREEIVLKQYYHIGIAVDTEQGLIVPVLRDVDKKNLLELSRELQTLAEKARQRKVALEELQGGSFTISNQGGIGGAHFTPIINRPEVAILGVGQGAAKAVVRGGKVVTRTMLPLALSYDHRLIDGAQAARFIKDLVEAIEQFPEKKYGL